MTQHQATFVTASDEVKQAINKTVDLKDVDQMHLLVKTGKIKGLTPEAAVQMLGAVDITFNKRHVAMLMEKFEVLNTDLTSEVLKQEAEVLWEIKRIEQGEAKVIAAKIE